MASLDTLPPDQRAVLGLVLQRGRSYDEIAELLSIDRAAVRQRALSGLEALGPRTQLPADRRALITDYLLGQLPPQVAAETRARLASSPSERAWARVVAAELSSLAPGGLPEIPVEAEEAPLVPEATGEPIREPEPILQPPVEPEPAPARARKPAAAAVPERPPRARQAVRRSSRRGGALLLLALAAVVIAAVVVVLVFTTGGSSKHKTSSSTTAARTSTTTSTTPQVLGQVNLSSPSSSSTKGVAQVIRSGSTTGVVIRAQNVPPNSKHDAYAVWLYNSASDAHLLGFVNPQVGSNRTLSTAGPLPTNAAHYKNLIVTRETTAKPKQPGAIVLQGQLVGLS